MTHVVKASLAALAAAATLVAALPAAAQTPTNIRVGWCTSVLTTGASPLAIAEHFGWFADRGLDVDVVNFDGSSDCIRNVATGEVKIVVATIEPLAILSLSGVEAQVFSTVFRRNIFGVAVPEGSPIQTYADLKGAQIGVTSMASSGVMVARSAVKGAGLDPDKDVNIVVSGQPGQSAVLLQRNEIQAVSQWDTNYTLMGMAGSPMRMLEDPVIAKFPANSLIAMKSTIETEGDVLALFGQAYAQATLFAIENPREAIRIFHETYPQVVGTGMTAEEALDRETELMETVATKWTLNDETTKWGESSMDTYAAYTAWMLENGVIETAVPAEQIANNALIDQINAGIDQEAIKAALAQ